MLGLELTVPDAPSDKTLASAAVIAKAVPQIAGALISLSALGCFIGWRDASSYFNTLGAPWAVSGLSATMLLESSAGLVFIFALSAYVAVSYLANGLASVRGIGWATVACLTLSFVLFLPTLVEWLGLGATTIYSLATCAALLFAIAGGLTFAELVARYRDADSRFHPRLLWLAYWVVLYGVMQAPDKLGQARAQYHLDINSDGLSAVSLPGATTSDNWRLVYVADGKALLMLPSIQREKTIFRLVEAKDLLSIKSTLQAKR